VRNILIYFIYFARNTRCHREILGASEKFSSLSEKYSSLHDEITLHCNKFFAYLSYLVRNTRCIREILVATKKNSSLFGKNLESKGDALRFKIFLFFLLLRQQQLTALAKKFGTIIVFRKQSQ